MSLRARCEASHNQYLDVDLEDLEDLEETIAVCRVCGCTEDDACETPNGTCFWLESDLCSACAEAT